MRLLLVEDEEGIAKFISQGLREAGHRVDWAKDGEKGLEYALDAEYGHGGGMFVNVTTKGGTNDFHGNVYEFFRNDKLNANSFFANKAGTKRPVFRFNQYGLTAGGPVIKNKVFWFFNFEGLRQRTPRTYRFTVPTAARAPGRV